MPGWSLFWVITERATWKLILNPNRHPPMGAGFCQRWPPLVTRLAVLLLFLATVILAENISEFFLVCQDNKNRLRVFVYVFVLTSWTWGQAGQPQGQSERGGVPLAGGSGRQGGDPAGRRGAGRCCSRVLPPSPPRLVVFSGSQSWLKVFNCGDHGYQSLSPLWGL